MTGAYGLSAAVAQNMRWHLLREKAKADIRHRRSHLIRKPVPDLRAPASIGGARGRRQYPHPGIADQLELLAIVALAAEEFLSGRLAGECEELRTKCRDGMAQPGAIRRRQFWKRGAVHPRARFHQIGQADPDVAAGCDIDAAAAAPASAVSRAESSRTCFAGARSRPARRRMSSWRRFRTTRCGGNVAAGRSARPSRSGSPTGSPTRSLRSTPRRRRRACGQRPGPG